MSEHYDEALVEDLAQKIHAEWCCGGPGFAEDDEAGARAVLDRLVELGRLEAPRPERGSLVQRALTQRCYCGAAAYAHCAACDEMTADCYCEDL